MAQNMQEFFIVVHIHDNKSKIDKKLNKALATSVGEELAAFSP